MEMTGRIAIAKIVIRSKESLAAIRVFQNGVLAMETMHFPDEVRSPAGLTGIIEPELRQQEIEMATNLVASLAGDFRPEKFQNEYREAVLERIAAKVNGEEIVEVEAPAERGGRVVDLMEALRASIRQAEEARGAALSELPAAPVTVVAPAAVPGGPPGVTTARPTPGIPGAPGLVPGAPAQAPGIPGAPGLIPGPVPTVAPPAPGFIPPGQVP